MTNQHAKFAERTHKPTSPAPWDKSDVEEGGPRRPDVQGPETEELLKKMRRVDPNQAKRYRQRTGQ